MMCEFEKKVAAFIKVNGLFDSADRIVLALSGGADSMALLYAMVSLKNEDILHADIMCAHINHQLRGADADADEDFSVACARDLQLPIATRRVNVRDFARKNKLSIETAARRLRIQTLMDIAKENNCVWITTAHHKNDNAETILQRLVRGTGFRGLAGIWPTRIFADDICFARPLLSVTRNEVIEYLQKRSLKWRTDHTNADCTYTRNFVRHQLLPELQQDCSGSLVGQLSQLAASAVKLHSLVCNYAEKVWPEIAECSDNEIKLNLKMFLTQPPPVKVELVRRSLTAVGSGQRDVTRQHFKRILNLARQNVTGRKIELPSDFVVQRDYDYIVFFQPEKSSTPDELIDKSIKVQVPGQTEFGQYVIEAAVLETGDCDIEKLKTEKTKYVERFDLDNIKLPLEVRLRRPGDRFWPFGLASEKKIGKFLTAAKVPRRLRHKLLVIADSEKIIWLWPLRICEQTRVTEKTKKILQLQITETEQRK